MQYQRANRLLIRDEVHGDMTFDPLLERVIDHSAVQRLRGIKQLGLAEYIFPCATHTRFQHSLGASYLAGRYFKNFTEQWMSAPLHFDGKSEGTQFYTAETFRCIRAVVESSSSRKYWYQVVSLAGLLHDVGHGPWSHTFESLPFAHNFEKSFDVLPEVLRDHYQTKHDKGERLMHEDISVLYIFSIFRELETQGSVPEAGLFALPVCLLVHRKLALGAAKLELEKLLSEVLERHHIEGGMDFYRLVSPVISGPFDVDRMDYIQRDGRNCGVSIGAIEWRRIVNKLVPCLADHASEGEPSEVVLLSSIKNQHVLDDFVFRLFQMYTQVYLHPKIVGLEEVIRAALFEKQSDLSKYEITLARHQWLSDERLRELFHLQFKIDRIEELLLRKGLDFDVVHYPADPKMLDELKKSEFEQVQSLDRAMIKERLGLFLYSRFKETAEREKTFFSPWFKVSPIAKHFYSVNYSPSFWVRQKKRKPLRDPSWHRPKVSPTA